MHNPEGEPLLPEPDYTNDRREHTPISSRWSRRWKATPYWLIPVIITVYMARGVTTASRIQVYNAIACRSLSNQTTQPISNLYILRDCTSPEVSAKAANIQAAVVTTMSVLSAVSTGFWSRLSETYGRKPIFITYLAGTIFGQPDTIFGRNAERLLLLGPFVEGAVGGHPILGGIVHAYISDCTPHGSRSKIFSTMQGILYIGLAAGPWFTGLILPPMSTTDIYFYISMSLMTFTLAYIILLCPESLESAVTWPVRVSPHLDDEPSKVSTLDLTIRLTLKFLSTLASPIVMFAPRPLVGYPQKKSYSLTLVGLAFFLYMISNGIYTTKSIFAQHLYSWTTTQLGNYLSLLWIMKAVNLLVLLPIVISYLKPKVSTATSLQPRELVEELGFDRHLAQASLLLDGTADLLVALASGNSQIIFMALSCVTSLTSGTIPALHSLGAVCLHACGYSSEVGMLFGAKAVVSAVAHIISPSIFSNTYAATVAHFPQAIFLLTTTLLYSCLILLAFVRPSLRDIEIVHSTREAGELPSNVLLSQEEDIEEAEQS
ncbi:hypothetical protein AX14_001070 [Amanita brunnescens Koide BX004]|nr:hypothetical protein AX14_001070 [Amanita brunnescens Koide BX004]